MEVPCVFIIFGLLMKGIMVLSVGLEGDVFYSRQEDRTCDLPLRGFRSYPVLVLSINWADSSLGYSWPVYYYVSWIPFNVHYMVTASYDHKDICLLYTSDAADDSLRVDLGGRRIIKKNISCASRECESY